MQDNVQCPHGFAQIHQNKHQAHGHCGNSQELSKNCDLAEFLDIVKVIGQDHHDGRGCHADQEGELGNIDAPGNVPAHAGYSQAFCELVNKGGGAYPVKTEQNQY